MLNENIYSTVGLSGKFIIALSLQTWPTFGSPLIFISLVNHKIFKITPYKFQTKLLARK